MHTGSGWGNLRKKDNLGDLGVDEMTIDCILKKHDVVVNRIDLSEQGHFVNAVTNLRLP